MAGTTKEYIESLNSFTMALDQLVQTLVEKEKQSGSNGAEVLEELFTSSKDTFKMIEAITEDVRDLKENVKASNAKSDEILKTVKAIKQKKEKGIFEKIEKEDNKQAIVDGIKTIVLIGGAILAIGLAFKVIGQVDFVSVLALSIALPLIAHAFAKISEIGDLDYNTAISMGLILVIASTAMMISSHILAQTAKLSPEVAMTAIMIGTIFTVVSIGAAYMIEALDGAGLKEVLLLGLTMVLVSAAIMISSIILQYTVPIPFWDVIIAAVTIGIVSIVMAITMWVITKLLKISTAIEGSILLVVISAAIMLSSHILAAGNYTNYPALDWGIAVGVTVLLLAPSILLLGIPALAPFFLIGSIMLLIVATSIMATSHILAAGNYDTYPSLGWGLAVGLTMGIFGPVMLALGFIGLLLPIVLLGASVMITIAKTIVEISMILSEGKFDGIGNMIAWTAATVMMFSVFAPMIILLGVMSVGMSVFSLFGGPDPMEEGRNLLKKIALTIVEISEILSKGKFEGGPSAEWAHAVGYSLVMFMKALSMATPGIWDVPIEEKIGNLKSAVTAMVAIAMHLGKLTGEGVFDPNKAPSKEWAEGVGIAITKFMEALNIANEKSMWDSMGDFFGGDSMGEKISVLYRVVDAMVNIANYLSSKSAVFSKGPSKEWAEGVGGSIVAFSNAIVVLQTANMMSKLTGESSTALLVGIAQAMVGVGTVLSTNSSVFAKGPSKTWSVSMEALMMSFWKIHTKLQGVSPEETSMKMKSIAASYVDMFKLLNSVNTQNKENDPFIVAAKGIDTLASAFMRFGEAIKSMGAATKDITSDALGIIRSISLSVMAMSAVDANNLENVLSKLRPEDVAKLYTLSAEAAQSSQSEKPSNVNLSAGASGIVKETKMQTIEVQKQTKELVNIKKELVKLNSLVTRIASNTDEMLDVKTTNGGGTTISH